MSVPGRLASYLLPSTSPSSDFEMHDLAVVFVAGVVNAVAVSVVVVM